jgi:pilus assembly protein CpaF
MQCRQPSLEGTGEISLRRLVKEALRMRPDRLVVGEVREAESLDLLIALNSGIPGMCSIHANTAQDALAKLCTLPLLAGRNIDSAFVVPTVASAVDIVVHCELLRTGARRIAEISATTGRITQTAVETNSIFALRHGVLETTGAIPVNTAKFQADGVDLSAILGSER